MDSWLPEMCCVRSVVAARALGVAVRGPVVLLPFANTTPASDREQPLLICPV